MCGHAKPARASQSQTQQSTLPQTPGADTTPTDSAANKPALPGSTAPSPKDTVVITDASSTTLDAIISGGASSTTTNTPYSRLAANPPALSAAESARINQQNLDADLLQAQTAIIERFGNLHISPLSPKVTQFPEAGGYLPSHLFDVVGGMGLTLARVHEYGDHHQPDLNQPDLLFYVPANPEKPALGGDFTDLIADGDYLLVGWGYYADYIPGEIPQISGLSEGTTIPESEWFIHESGWHTIDGGFEPTPPQGESWRGEAPGVPPTRATHKPDKMPVGAHGRVWDLHVFRSDLKGAETSAPVLSILAPQAMTPYFPKETLDLSAGFFYPENPAIMVAKD